MQTMDQQLLVIVSLALLHLTSGDDNYKVTKTAWLDVDHGDKRLGRIELGLFGDTVPKTVDNFYLMATGTQPSFANPFKGSPFHRVIKDFMIQGGDTTTGDGMGGKSTFNDGDAFPDENFIIQMNGPGWLCMANSGKDTNKSQFFITTANTPWLQGKHVCFGKVTGGMGVVNQMQNVAMDTSNNQKPAVPLTIAFSGGADANPPFEVDKNPVPIPT